MNNNQHEDKERKLGLMRFWLFGTFVIVFSAVTTYLGLFTNRNAFLAIQISTPIWLFTAVLCVITYYLYKWILERKP